jgi:hypothetical protein
LVIVFAIAFRSENNTVAGPAPSGPTLSPPLPPPKASRTVVPSCLSIT